MKTKFEYLQIGMVIGINISLSKEIDKFVTTMQSEAISEHDVVSAMSEDIELIKQLLFIQKNILSNLAEEEDYERACSEPEETT